MRMAVFAALLLAPSALTQTPAPVHRTAHPLTVNADHTITFRYFDPAAAKVSVSVDRFEGHPLAMTRDATGLWSVTTPPLAPEFYGYDLIVDGLAQLDPLNPDVRLNYAFLANQVMVPGDPPAPWELTDVPHGRVEHIYFTSHVVQHLPNSQSAYMVYTPPGYDEHRKGGYPVLYLLHGWSDKEGAWVSTGRADLMLDNLIAAGKAVPMIVVMPLGYGDLNFVQKGSGVWADPAKVQANLDFFTQSLLTEVMPAVARHYNVAPDRLDRAIVGLSMGGQESVSIGLRHPDQFAWVGGMSPAVQGDFLQKLPALDAKSADLRLFWVACGTDESLLAPSRALAAWGRAHGLPTTAVEIPGAHVWLTWRDNFIHFVPLLFRSAQ
jgi:enterochelin esterase family protein